MLNRFRTLFLATSALLLLGLMPAAANPLGAQVVGGSATVQGQGTSTVTVTQQTNSAIINWNTFNIGVGEKTKIFMPSSSSVQLDRVTGGLGPSQILGSLWSNGRVFLVNPDGILFGAGAVVDTAGFLATTHDIANADFMAGRYNFSIPGNPSASIVNQGTITAQTGGFAALVAPGVRNSGTITATLGTVALASGNGFTLDFYGDKLITLGVNDSIAATVKDVATGQPLSSLVSNDGKLSANGGRVELTAAAARTVVDSVINNTGVIEANSIGTHNGMIVLSAATAGSKPAGAPAQTVKLAGKISAAGKDQGTKGGTVVVTGENIVVTGATIDASGVAGGGAVLIGGDTGGGNPSPLVASLAEAQLEANPVPTATSVSIDATTTIDASATSSGEGGKVVVWSDGATSFNGTIFARGGANGGNGGFVETSSHGDLSFSGMVDLSAPQGQHGTLLLDPLNATIDTNPGNPIITVASIENALATGDVIVSTAVAGSDAGDITAAASVSWANASTLTLSANRDITVNSGVTIANTGAGNLLLRADSAGTGVGAVNFIGTGKVDFSQSTGAVSIFYNPADNPAGSVINTASYTSPANYSPHVIGQLTSYMLVNTVYDLQNIQNNLSGTYALGKDIDASATANWNGGAGFVPIGNLPGSGLPFFTGLLDGMSHAVDHLTINSSGAAWVGLFSLVYFGGDVRNVGLTNASVNSTYLLGAEIGGLAGLNAGTISNSFVTGTVTGDSQSTVGGLVGANQGTITHSYSTANVSGSGSSSTVGGLVGLDDGGPIDNSYATGTVTNGLLVGGLVGFIGHAVVTQSFATGAVSGSGNGSPYSGGIGGLVGSCGECDIIQSYATGAVTGDNGAAVGGLAGYVFGATISQSYSTGSVSGSNSTVGALVGVFVGGIDNSYWNLDTAGSTGVGAFFGGNLNGVFGLTTAQLKAGLPNGFNVSTPVAPLSAWGINANINGGYPYLLWQVASTPSTPTILTPSQLQIITIDANPETKIYGSADPFLTYTIVSGNLGSATLSGSLTRVPGANVGSYTIGEGSLSLPAGYEIIFVNSSLTITPATLTYVANPVSRLYGSFNPTLSGSVTGFVNGDTLASSTIGTRTFSTAAMTSSNVGSYTITGSGLTANNGNYVFTQAPGNATALTINPAPLTITADDKSRAFGQANPALTATANGLVNGDGVGVVSGLSITTAATTNSAAGNYPIVPFGATAANYTISYVNGVLTVTPTPTPVTYQPLTGFTDAFGTGQIYFFTPTSNTPTSNIIPISISTQTSGSTTQVIVTPNSANEEWIIKLIDLALKCSQDCVKAPSQFGFDFLVNKILETTKIEPAMSSESTRYQVVVASGGLIITIVGIVTGLAEVAGVAAITFKSLELLVRPAVALSN